MRNKNFTGIPLNAIPVDTEYDSCNFMRRAPDMSGPEPEPWDLFPGYSGPPITFKDCNLINVRPPAGSVLISCNTTMQEYGLVDREETLIIDGVERGPRRVYYKSRWHGRVNPDTLDKELLPTPVERVNQRPNRK